MLNPAAKGRAPPSRPPTCRPADNRGLTSLPMPRKVGNVPQSVLKPSRSGRKPVSTRARSPLSHARATWARPACPGPMMTSEVGAMTARFARQTQLWGRVPMCAAAGCNLGGHSLLADARSRLAGGERGRDVEDRSCQRLGILDRLVVTHGSARQRRCCTRGCGSPPS